MANLDITTNDINDKISKHDNMQILIAVTNLFTMPEKEALNYFETKSKIKAPDEKKVAEYKDCFEFFKNNLELLKKTTTATYLGSFSSMSREDFANMTNGYIHAFNVNVGLDVLKLYHTLKTEIDTNGKINNETDISVAKVVNSFKNYCRNHIAENYKTNQPIVDFETYLKQASNGNIEGNNENGAY